MVPSPTAIRWEVVWITMARVLREVEEEGWRISYTVDMWAAGEEVERRVRGAAGDQLDHEYTGLSQDTTYTLALETSPGMGVSHQVPPTPAPRLPPPGPGARGAPRQAGRHGERPGGGGSPHP